MKNVPIIHDSFTKKDLLAQFDIYAEEMVAFYESLPLDMFRSKSSVPGWTIEKNYKHICGSTKIFYFMFFIPKFIFKLFGKPKNPQLKIKDFGPPTERPDAILGKYVGKGEISVKERDKITEKWRNINRKFRSKIEKFSEEDLENTNTPIAGYNLRQIVLFVMLHNIHHANIVRKRLEDSNLV
jgi:hypothetical protein